MEHLINTLILVCHLKSDMELNQLRNNKCFNSIFECMRPELYKTHANPTQAQIDKCTKPWEGK